MGTTINVHLHDDETPSVSYGDSTGWPDITVKGEHGRPITSIALLWDPAPLGVVGVGMLDNAAVQAALTPTQLTLLARIVAERAPQFALYQAGLFRADAADTGRRRVNGYDIELAGHCDNCNGLAGWVLSPEHNRGDAVHVTGLFACPAAERPGECRIGGRVNRAVVELDSEA